jgi:hypothetical protein
MPKAPTYAGVKKQFKIVPDADRLQRHFARLSRQLSVPHNANAIKTCNQSTATHRDTAMLNRAQSLS